MAQESYADYSIIHKYFQQEKLHEEELQRLKDQNKELNEQLSQANVEVERMASDLREYKEENQEMKQSLIERENEVNRLNTTISSLNQKIANMTKMGR